MRGGHSILFAIPLIRSVNKALLNSIGKLTVSAEEVTIAAAQVSTSSHGLAQAAAQQAASIEETSASTEEINSMARRNTDNSHRAAGSVASSNRTREDTSAFLGKMVKAMNDIRASGDEISKIIKVIDDIAFQTNILALNATNVLIETSVTRSINGQERVSQVVSAIRLVAGRSSEIRTGLQRGTQTAAASAEESAAAAEEFRGQADGLKAVVEELSELAGLSSK